MKLLWVFLLAAAVVAEEKKDAPAKKAPGKGPPAPKAKAEKPTTTPYPTEVPPPEIPGWSTCTWGALVFMLTFCCGPPFLCVYVALMESVKSGTIEPEFEVLPFGDVEQELAIIKAYKIEEQRKKDEQVEEERKAAIKQRKSVIAQKGRTESGVSGVSGEGEGDVEAQEEQLVDCLGKEFGCKERMIPEELEDHMKTCYYLEPAWYVECCGPCIACFGVIAFCCGILSHYLVKVYGTLKIELLGNSFFFYFFGSIFGTGLLYVMHEGEMDEDSVELPEKVWLYVCGALFCALMPLLGGVDNFDVIGVDEEAKGVPGEEGYEPATQPLLREEWHGPNEKDHRQMEVKQFLDQCKFVLQREARCIPLILAWVGACAAYTSLENGVPSLYYFGAIIIALRIQLVGKRLVNKLDLVVLVDDAPYDRQHEDNKNKKPMQLDEEEKLQTTKYADEIELGKGIEKEAEFSTALFLWGMVKNLDFFFSLAFPLQVILAEPDITRKALNYEYMEIFEIDPLVNMLKVTGWVILVCLFAVFVQLGCLLMLNSPVHAAHILGCISLTNITSELEQKDEIDMERQSDRHRGKFIKYIEAVYVRDELENIIDSETEPSYCFINWLGKTVKCTSENSYNYLDDVMEGCPVSFELPQIERDPETGGQMYQVKVIGAANCGSVEHKDDKGMVIFEKGDEIYTAVNHSDDHTLHVIVHEGNKISEKVFKCDPESPTDTDGVEVLTTEVKALKVCTDEGREISAMIDGFRALSQNAFMVGLQSWFLMASFHLVGVHGRAKLVSTIVMGITLTFYRVSQFTFFVRQKIKQGWKKPALIPLITIFVVFPIGVSILGITRLFFTYGCESHVGSIFSLGCFDYNMLLHETENPFG